VTPDGDASSDGDAASEDAEAPPVDASGDVKLDGTGDVATPAVASAGDIATRLARFLWAKSSASTEIEAQVAADPSPEGIANIAKVMLADARARDGVDAFFRWLLRLDDLATQPKSIDGLTPNLRASLAREAPIFANSVMFDGDDSFESLFLAPYTFMDGVLAGHYGVSKQDGAAFDRTPYPTRDRVGILGGAGVLTRYAGTSQPTWPARRYWLLSDVLTCELFKLAAPSPAVLGTPTDPNLPVRAQLIEVTKSSACMECHVVVNPLGFAFNAFDTLGRQQDSDVNVPVDSSGGTPAVGMVPALTFQGQADLMQKLVALPATRACYAHRLFAYAINDSPPGSDMDHGLADLKSPTFRSGLKEVMARFEAGGSLKDLWIEVVRNPSFWSETQ
jgi:hypothetical protein